MNANAICAALWTDAQCIAVEAQHKLDVGIGTSGLYCITIRVPYALSERADMYCIHVSIDAE